MDFIIVFLIIWFICTSYATAAVIFTKYEATRRAQKMRSAQGQIDNAVANKKFHYIYPDFLDGATIADVRKLNDLAKFLRENERFGINGDLYNKLPKELSRYFEPWEKTYERYAKDAGIATAQNKKPGGKRK